MVRTKRSAGKRQRTHFSPSPPRMEAQQDFPSPQALHTFKSGFENRKVNPGRIFDLEVLGEANFTYLDNLRTRKWLPLIELKTPVFLDYVRIFYSNAHSSFGGHEYNDRVKSFLQNSAFEINPATMAQFLDLENKGSVYNPLNFNSLEACRIISANPTLARPFSSLKNLSVDIRILHLIVCQVFNPRKGNFAKLYPEDLWFLQNIIDKKDINLPTMICSKIVHARSHPKQILPYGCLLSAFLRTKFPHLSSLSILPENQIPVFNHTSLRKMGCVYDHSLHKYIKVVNRHQRYRHAEESENEATDEDDNADDEVPAQHHEAGSSSQVTPDMIASIRTLMLDGFANVNRRLEENIQHFDSKVQELKATIDSNHHHTRDRLDSLQDQIGNLEHLVSQYLSDDSDAPSPAI